MGSFLLGFLIFFKRSLNDLILLEIASNSPSRICSSYKLINSSGLAEKLGQQLLL